jgi:sulfate adenylyltransferase
MEVVMLRLAEPHAGILVNRIVEVEKTRELRDRAARLPQLTLAPREAADLELIANGAASPLTGFMGLRDYRTVLERLRLTDGTPWPIPFTLAVTIPEMALALRDRAAALRDSRGRLRAVLEVSDAFVRDPREEARALYGSDDPTRRPIAYLLSRPAGTLGGLVSVLPQDESLGAVLPPRDVRAAARSERWAGLRALAALDGVGCLEPIGGARPSLLPVPRVPVRQAPGRDAFLQAIVLKNFGAREVVFEHERADWFAVSPEIAPEDLGVAPVWIVGNRSNHAAAATIQH